MESIWRLAPNDVHWICSHASDTAFPEMKQFVTKTLVLTFYNPSKTLTIQYDSSLRELGAALLQQEMSITYANRARIDTEQKYAQIET